MYIKTKSILSLILLIFLISCSKQNTKVTKIKLTKIATITDEIVDEYKGTMVEFAHIVDNELMFVDGQNSEVLIYDFDSFKFKKKFGKKGKGPGEFIWGTDVIKSKSNEYYVNDLDNMKILVFNENGDEERSERYLGGYHFFTKSNEIFISSFGTMPRANITQLTSESDTLFVDEIITKSVKDGEKKYMKTFTDEQDLYISFFYHPKVLKLSNNNYELLDYTNPQLDLPEKIYHQFFTFKDGWLRECFSFDPEDEENLDAKLSYYSKDFELIKTIDLKDYSDLKNANLVAVEGDFAIFNAMADGMIYKYKIELN